MTCADGPGRVGRGCDELGATRHGRIPHLPSPTCHGPPSSSALTPQTCSGGTGDGPGIAGNAPPLPSVGRPGADRRRIGGAATDDACRRPLRHRAWPMGGVSTLRRLPRSPAETASHRHRYRPADQFLSRLHGLPRSGRVGRPLGGNAADRAWAARRAAPFTSGGERRYRGSRCSCCLVRAGWQEVPGMCNAAQTTSLVW